MLPEEDVTFAGAFCSCCCFLLQHPLSEPFHHTDVLNSTCWHCFSLHTKAARLDDEVVLWVFLLQSLLRVCVSGETKRALTFP